MEHHEQHDRRSFRLRPRAVLWAAVLALGAALGAVAGWRELPVATAQQAPTCSWVQTSPLNCPLSVSNNFPSAIQCNQQQGYAVWVGGELCGPVPEGTVLHLKVFSQPNQGGLVRSFDLPPLDEGDTSFEWSTELSAMPNPVPFVPRSYTISRKDSGDLFVQFRCVGAASYCRTTAPTPPGSGVPRPTCVQTLCAPLTPPPATVCQRTERDMECVGQGVRVSFGAVNAPDCEGSYTLSLRGTLCDPGGQAQLRVWVQDGLGQWHDQGLINLATVNDYVTASYGLNFKPVALDYQMLTHSLGCVTVAVHCSGTLGCLPSLTCCDSCDEEEEYGPISFVMAPNVDDPTEQLMWTATNGDATVPAVYELEFVQVCPAGEEPEHVVVQAKVDDTGQLHVGPTDLSAADQGALIEVAVGRLRGANPPCTGLDGLSPASTATCFAAARHGLTIAANLEGPNDTVWEFVAVTQTVDEDALNSSTVIEPTPLYPDQCEPAFGEQREFTLGTVDSVVVTRADLGGGCNGTATRCAPVPYANVVQPPQSGPACDTAPLIVDGRVTAWRMDGGTAKVMATFTTDATVIQRAIDWSVADSRFTGRVHLPAGAFAVPNTITIDTAEVILIGSGGRDIATPWTQLLPAGATGFFEVSGDADGSQIWNLRMPGQGTSVQNGVTVSSAGSVTVACNHIGASLSGVLSTNNTGNQILLNEFRVDLDGVELNEVVEAFVENNAVQTAGRHGISSDGGESITLFANEIEETLAGNGIVVTDSGPATVVDFNDLHDVSLAHDAIFVGQSPDIDVTNNVVRSGKHGITILQSQGAELFGNKVLPMLGGTILQNGYQITHSDNAVVVDNDSVGVFHSGFLIDDSDDVTLQDNLAASSGMHGIAVRFIAGIAIDNNDIRDNGRNGLNVDDSSGWGGSQIVDNTFSCNGFAFGEPEVFLSSTTQFFELLANTYKHSPTAPFLPTVVTVNRRPILPTRASAGRTRLIVG